MANNKSALKRIKTNERNKNQNKKYKVELKRALKQYLKTVEDQRTNPNDTTVINLKQELSTTYQKFDKCVKANILHKNTAARKKSKLVALFHMVNVSEVKHLDLPKIKIS
jgi:small subunit ribosomal protein S20